MSLYKYPMEFILEIKCMATQENSQIELYINSFLEVHVGQMDHNQPL